MASLYLEICCGSAEDAVAAWKGGADRVELNSDLFHGGLTPTIGALRVIKTIAPELPTMCMVRPREGGFCYTDIEFQVMLEDARMLLENGADGIVFGILHEDGTVDVERCRKLMGVIGNHESVFHRAIDVTPNLMEALDTVISLGVTRILTSGQRPTVPEGADNIRAMVTRAAGRIQILPGGGVRPENAAWCRNRIGVDALHTGLHRTAYDRSTDVNPDIFFGSAVFPPEDRYKITFAEDVANFRSEA